MASIFLYGQQTAKTRQENREKAAPLFLSIFMVSKTANTRQDNRAEAGPRTRVRVHSEESGRVPVELQRRTLARVLNRIRDVVGVERPHKLVPLFQVRHRTRLRFVVDIPADIYIAAGFIGQKIR